VINLWRLKLRTTGEKVKVELYVYKKFNQIVLNENVDKLIILLMSSNAGLTVSNN
jgi:hypothetical protein